MAKNDNYVTLDGITIKHQTQNALLIVYCDDEYWIPFSQILDWDEKSIDITEWIAQQKGLA